MWLEKMWWNSCRTQAKCNTSLAWSAVTIQNGDQLPEQPFYSKVLISYSGSPVNTVILLQPFPPSWLWNQYYNLQNHMPFSFQLIQNGRGLSYNNMSRRALVKSPRRGVRWSHVWKAWCFRKDWKKMELFSQKRNRLEAHVITVFK